MIIVQTKSLNDLTEFDTIQKFNDLSDYINSIHDDCQIGLDPTDSDVVRLIEQIHQNPFKITGYEVEGQIRIRIL